MELDGKTIAITGAGRGLGAAMAARLAGCGCKLALIDIDDDALQKAAEHCRDEGSPDVATYVCNIADETAVENLFVDIAGQFGALHGLVNNAGITRDALTVKADGNDIVDRMSLAQWQMVIDVNLTGTFVCGREAAATMIKLGCEGVIINISSISRAGNIGQANYSASKAGVESLAVVWAKEFARYGIRSASIAPGFIGTEMVKAMKPEALEKLSGMIPLRRIGEADHIAGTVQFILENDYVSGRCFEIDAALRL